MSKNDKKENYLIEYKKEIDKGNIVVGQELYLELENLINDLENKEYYFDRTDTLKRINFMEHCVRLTKSPYYNKPMKLMLWQKAFLEAVYSFKMATDGTDRFKQVILLIARKNTKSETCSGLGLTELIIGNAGSDIVCSSNNNDQAAIVYEAINTMRQLVDPLDQDTKRNQICILNKLTNSRVFKLSDRTKNKEGRNIDFAIVDETNEMKEDVIIKSIEQSQSLKENPKLIEITTEGFVVDGHLDRVLQRARKIIAGESDSIADKRFLPWLYTQDSEQEIWNGNRENKLWMKSNPTIGVIKRWDYLEEQVDKARTSKSDRVFVLAKDFNIKTSENASWLNLEDYDYDAKFDINDFRDTICLGAVDLSQTTDLTCAKTMLMKANDSHKYIYTKYFIPEAKLKDDKNDSLAGARYEEWAKAGLITVCEGNDVNLATVADWFWQLYEKYNIRLWKCGYDQKFSKEWIHRMNDYGWVEGSKDDADLIVILQNAQTLSNAMKLTEADFRNKLINYNNNEVDKWCLSNAGIKVDNNDMALCVKREKNKRIDGAVTFIILYEMYRRYRTDFNQYLLNRIKDEK